MPARSAASTLSLIAWAIVSCTSSAPPASATPTFVTATASPVTSPAPAAAATATTLATTPVASAASPPATIVVPTVVTTPVPQAPTSPPTQAPTAAPAAAAPTPAGTSTVTGVVRWWDEPIANARVRLIHFPAVGGTVSLSVASTDATGRYRFAGLAAGSYRTTLEPPYPPEAEGGFISPGSRTVADGATVELIPTQVTKKLTVYAPLKDQQVSSPFNITWSDEFGRSVSYRVMISQDNRSLLTQMTSATEIRGVTLPTGTYVLSITGSGTSRDGGTVTIASAAYFFTVR